MPSADAKKSYQKALFFLVVIAAVLFVGTCVLKIVMSPVKPVRTILSSETPAGTPYSENQKDSVQRSVAGYWNCALPPDSSARFVTRSDRLELKPNGIYWRVTLTRVHLPSGDSASYVVASTGYLSPFGHAGSSPDTITCQIHYIGASVIAGTDTCYVPIVRPDASTSILPQLESKPKPGEGVVDTVWSLVADGERIALGDFRYTRFDTSGGAQAFFFLRGSVESVNKFSLGECTQELSPDLFIKHLLAKDFAGRSVPQRTEGNIRAAADEYYKKYFAQNLARRVTVFGKGRIALGYSVDASGKVGGDVTVASRPWNMKLNRELKIEVQSWVFPACPSQSGPVRSKMEISY